MPLGDNRSLSSRAFLLGLIKTAAFRPSRSQAISVEPEPPNRSATRSPDLLLLRRARSMSSTGFEVG